MKPTKALLLSAALFIGIASVHASETPSVDEIIDRAFQSCKGRGIGTNYFDVESREGYWISSIKQKGGRPPLGRRRPSED